MPNTAYIEIVRRAIVRYTQGRRIQIAAAVRSGDECYVVNAPVIANHIRAGACITFQSEQHV